MKSQLVLVLWCINLCSKLAASIPFHEDSAHLVGAQQASGGPSNVPENSNAHSQLHNFVALSHSFNPEHLFPRAEGSIQEEGSQKLEQGQDIRRQALSGANSVPPIPHNVNAPVSYQGLPSPYNKGMFRPEPYLNQEPKRQVQQNQQHYLNPAEAPTHLPFIRQHMNVQQNQQALLRLREEERSNQPFTRIIKTHQEELRQKNSSGQLNEGPANVDLSRPPLVPVNQQEHQPSEVPNNVRAQSEIPLRQLGEVPSRLKFQQNEHVQEQPHQQNPGLLYVPSMAQLLKQSPPPFNQQLSRPSFEAPLRPVGELQSRQQSPEIIRQLSVNQPRAEYSTQGLPRQAAAPTKPQVPTQPFENSFKGPVENQPRQQFPAPPVNNHPIGLENNARSYSGLNRQQIAIENEWKKTMTEATRPKSRYIVVHPNGVVEYVDQLEPVAEKYPNYMMVNGQNPAANVPEKEILRPALPLKPSQSVTNPTTQIPLIQGTQAIRNTEVIQTQNNSGQTVQKNIEESATKQIISAPLSKSEPTTKEKQKIVKTEYTIETPSTSQPFQGTPVSALPIETHESEQHEISNSSEAIPEGINILLIHSEIKPQTDTVQTTKQSTPYLELQSNYYEAQEQTQASSESYDEENMIAVTETYSILESSIEDQSDSNTFLEVNNVGNKQQRAQHGQEETETLTESQRQTQNESTLNYQTGTENVASPSSASNIGSNTELKQSSSSHSQSQSAANNYENSDDKQVTNAGEVIRVNGKTSFLSKTQSKSQSQSSEEQMNYANSEKVQHKPYTWFTSQDPDFLDKLLGKDKIVGLIYFFMVPSNSPDYPDD